MKMNKKSSPILGILISVVFVAVGIGMSIFAINTIKKYNEKNKTYIEVTAIGVDYDYDDDNAASLIVEYTVNGVKYRKASNLYTKPAKPLGKEVKIKYNPKNPNDIIWKNDSTNIVLPIAAGIFVLIGVVGISVSIKEMFTSRDEEILEDTEDSLYLNDNENNINN